MGVVGWQLKTELGRESMIDLHSGTHGRYLWLESSNLFLPKLVRAVPALVQGRRVAVTSFDSGLLDLTAEETEAGWERRGSVAVSPVISEPSQLPHSEWDEWYVVEDWTATFEPQVFINYGGFSLRDPAYLTEGLHPTWDRAGAEAEEDRIREQLDRFWEQLELLSPISYLAEGDLLILATRDADLHKRCLAWARSHAA